MISQVCDPFGTLQCWKFSLNSANSAAVFSYLFAVLARSSRALSIRPKISEIPGLGANGTDISGISFRNFGCTSRGWPKIPENRNNRKIPFHSTIPARAQFLRARKSNSTWLPILLLNISVPLVIMRQMTWMFFCTTFAPEPRQTFVMHQSILPAPSTPPG